MLHAKKQDGENGRMKTPWARAARLLRPVCLSASLLAAAPAGALTITTEENPPLNFTKDGQVTGISTAVVREMIKRAGLSADIVILPWVQAYAKAKDNPDTCVYSAVRNTERESLFQWAGPIGRGEWSLFGLKEFKGEAKRVEDLKQYRIGVTNDARAVYLRGRGLTDLIVAERNLDLAAMLTADPKQLGRADLWMSQTYGAEELARQAGVGELKLVFPAIMSQDYWLACGNKTSPDTVRALSGAASAMRRDGTMRQLTAPPAPAPASR
jgi:polar amino acid transport system substrate-binding protein